MIQPAGERLIGLIAADLPDHGVVRAPDGRVTFVPETGGGPVLVVGARVKKRFLGRTEIAQFQTFTVARRWEPARLRVGQTGRLQRRGARVEVVEGSDEAASLAAALTSDAEFAVAAMALDFTRFDLEFDGERCATTVELIGASFVSIALPPIRSYVRLHPDQRVALIGCLAALQRVVGEGVDRSGQL